MTLGETIKAARKAKDLTLASVANSMGVSLQAVSQWESDTTTPTGGRLIKLSNLLGIDLAPAGGRRELLPFKAEGKVFAAPLISRVTAGSWSPVIAEQPLPPDTQAFEIHWEPAGYAFSLEIDGDSMLPEFQSGDVIIVDTGLRPLPGDCVVAAIESEEEATFKKYRPRGLDDNGQPIIELYPLNPDYPTLTISAKNPGRIVGTMNEHRRFRRRTR
ncbi:MULTISPECIES: XRE family transcriptional regulator [unclassified Mesorhizobium]|uniref:LexA family protein n=1 Tax=unclassified Mesorhizobium TaxID=325217 RepID=UPI0003D0053B|nr:XRE family transcriptional regulator [Mesorhizobium sp. L2C054A000]ESZ52798.1 repressor [Mesorhizobium sp. L2C054A000]